MEEKRSKKLKLKMAVCVMVYTWLIQFYNFVCWYDLAFFPNFKARQVYLYSTFPTHSKCFTHGRKDNKVYKKMRKLNNKNRMNEIDSIKNELKED